MAKEGALKESWNETGGGTERAGGEKEVNKGERKKEGRSILPVYDFTGNTFSRPFHLTFFHLFPLSSPFISPTGYLLLHVYR